MLTHDGDIVLYLEERLMTALGQEAEGLTVGGGVERDPVHVQQTVPRTQGPLSDTHTHTHTPRCVIQSLVKSVSVTCEE